MTSSPIDGAPATDSGIAPAGTASCPRCRYDLRGAMSQWSDACPLAGTCVECGLAFEWADLFDRSRRLPRWSIERGSRRLVALRWATTCLVACLPFRFWRAMRMTHEVRFGRLACFVAGIVLAPAILFVPLRGALATCSWLALNGWVSVPAGRGGTTTCSSSVSWIDALFPAIATPWSTSSPGTVLMTTTFPAPPGGAAGAPGTYRSTMRFAYPGPADLSGQLGPGYCVEWSKIPASIAGQSRRRTTANALSAWDITTNTKRAWPADWPGAGMGAVALLVSALAFFALPTSLRRAKVRPRHLVRMATYALVLLLVPLCLEPTIEYATAIAGTRVPYLPDHRRAIVLGMFVPLGGLFFWWIAACRCYLRLHAATAVGCAVATIGALVAMLVGAHHVGRVFP